jgi:hypothetical protein
MMAGTAQGNIQLPFFQAVRGLSIPLSSSSSLPAIAMPEPAPAGLSPDEIRRIVLDVIG